MTREAEEAVEDVKMESEGCGVVTDMYCTHKDFTYGVYFSLIIMSKSRRYTALKRIVGYRQNLEMSSKDVVQQVFR